MNGFLSTSEHFYECNYWEHLYLAQEIVEGTNVSVKNKLEAEDYLQDLGWVVVRTRDVYGKIGFPNEDGIRPHLTDAQKECANCHFKYMGDNRPSYCAHCGNMEGEEI